MTRNPRDTCVSFYNFIKAVEGYQGTLSDFTEAFLSDITCYYSPFLHHVLKFGYSEKATKFEKIFHFKFDVTG